MKSQNPGVVSRFFEHLTESEMWITPVKVFCWKRESEYMQLDSQIGMSSYSLVLIDKELNFCERVTFKMCIWINTFSLVAHNPDIPEGKADSSISSFQIECKKQRILNIEK